jgi:hypothetical protein
VAEALETVAVLEPSPDHSRPTVTAAERLMMFARAAAKGAGVDIGHAASAGDPGGGTLIVKESLPT